MLLKTNEILNDSLSGPDWQAFGSGFEPGSREALWLIMVIASVVDHPDQGAEAIDDLCREYKRATGEDASATLRKMEIDL